MPQTRVFNDLNNYALSICTQSIYPYQSIHLSSFAGTGQTVDVIHCVFQPEIINAGLCTVLADTKGNWKGAHYATNSAVAVGRKARSKKHNRLSVPCLLLESGVLEWRDLISRIPLAFIKYGKFAAILPPICADGRCLWYLEKCESCEFFSNANNAYIFILSLKCLYIILIQFKLK